jgi:hypothetical protein
LRNAVRVACDPLIAAADPGFKCNGYRLERSARSPVVEAELALFAASIQFVIFRLISRERTFCHGIRSSALASTRRKPAWVPLLVVQ